MIRKKTFQAALALARVVTSGLAVATATLAASRNSYPLDNALSCCVGSPLIGRTGELLGLVASNVGALISLCGDNESRRRLSAILITVGWLIVAMNYVFRLLGW